MYVYESIKGNTNYRNEIIGRIIRNNIYRIKTVGSSQNRICHQNSCLLNCWSLLL